MRQGVLFVIFSMSTGGTQRNMVNIINNINLNNKNKILFLYNATKTSYLEDQIDKSVKVYKVTSTSIIKHFFRLKELISIINNENISSIVSFAINGSYLALISKIILPFRKIPIIYRLVSIDSYLTYSRYLILSNLKSFLYINILCRFVNSIICQSEYMYNSLVKQSPKLLINKSLVIRNLIDTLRIDKNIDEDLKINYKYFIFLGRFSPEKNIIKIIEAFKIIKNQTDHKLLLIGNGNEYDNIKDFIKLCDLEDRVLMLGFKSNPYKYLQGSDALILFSEYEGLPNVVLESMYCKTPVIVSDFSGVDEIVKHNETGFIVEKNNIVMLADYMKKVISLNNSKIIINAHKFVLNLNNDSLSKYSNLIF